MCTTRVQKLCNVFRRVWLAKFGASSRTTYFPRRVPLPNCCCCCCSACALETLYCITEFRKLKRRSSHSCKLWLYLVVQCGVYNDPVYARVLRTLESLLSLLFKMPNNRPTDETNLVVKHNKMLTDFLNFIFFFWTKG